MARSLGHEDLAQKLEDVVRGSRPEDEKLLEVRDTQDHTSRLNSPNEEMLLAEFLNLVKHVLSWLVYSFGNKSIVFIVFILTWKVFLYSCFSLETSQFSDVQMQVNFDLEICLKSLEPRTASSQ